MRMRILLAVTLLFISINRMDAQLLARLANPQIRIAIEHPPALQLDLDRVLVRSEGKCSNEFAHYVTERFVAEGVEVVDRQHLDEIFEEQNFGLSGEVDRGTMVEAGRLAGATTLVSITSFGCSTETQRTTDGTSYISRRLGAFRASVQVIDITTGRKFTARSIDKSVAEQNSSAEGSPPFPSVDKVVARVLRQAAFEVHKWFFPWTETRYLYFFDDKECGLKEAFSRLKIGDIDGAARISESNLEECEKDPKAKPKRKAQARYNLGMVRFIQGKHEEALKLLTDAYAEYPKQLVADSIRDCKRAQALAVEMQAFAESMEEQETEIANGVGSESMPSPESSLEDRLRTLQGLFDKGLLTEADYNTKKEEILESL